MKQLENSVETIPLSALLAGNHGKIHSVVGNSELVKRLAEMGLRAGTKLEMVRPGATCILRLDGAKICLRGDELLRVMVTPVTPARHSA